MFPISPIDTTSAAGVQPVDAMVAQVCNLIGGAENPEIYLRGKAALDMAAGQMNLAGIYLTGLKEKTWTSFTDGQSTVPFPSDMGWPYGPMLLLDENGKVKNRVTWKSYDHFRLEARNPTETNEPYFASILGEAIDQTVHLWPAFGSGKSAYSLVMPYFTRIQRPSEANTLYVTDEIRQCLTLGGEAFIMRQRYLEQPAIWTPFWKTFLDAIPQAIASAGRWEAETQANGFYLEYDSYPLVYPGISTTYLVIR